MDKAPETHIMKARLLHDKIVVDCKDGTKFLLIPYQQTKDGEQQFFGIDKELERVVHCINDFDGVITDVIKGGFVRRALYALERGKQAVEATRKAFVKDSLASLQEARHGKEEETKSVEGLPPQDQGREAPQGGGEVGGDGSPGSPGEHLSERPNK